MSKITKSSTAEYFAKNLQQVGFSSPLKAVLTTLKEAVDNSLDACEEAGILPEIKVSVTKIGQGASRSTDLVEIRVEDNGPGLEEKYLPQVFGEYLASSKFGRGRCSRGQQGIGISAATTWAQLTNARGVLVLNKTDRMRKAIKGIIDVDIKGNKGVFKNREMVDWDKEHGICVTFQIDGRVQLNGDGGLLTYIEGTTLVNPHLTIEYKLLDSEPIRIERVSDEIPDVPPATLPHPHTMKLGEFMTHTHLYGNITLSNFLKKAFSRVTDHTIKDFVKNGLPKNYLNKPLAKTSETEFKKVFQAIQETQLSNPTTKSVLIVGEEGLAKSIQRLGQVDFFSVVTRKPQICDFKPVVVEVAIARFISRSGSNEDEPIQLLRFANRVPLQFDKGACAITKAVETVNWKSYGLGQPKRSLPMGPYVFAVSVTSPFIKFKNASKETIDASDELVEEIRRALMQAGQKLSRHIRREDKALALEKKLAHIEKFGPILVEGLAGIIGAGEKRKKAAAEGLMKILGRDTQDAKSELVDAEKKLSVLKAKQAEKLGIPLGSIVDRDVETDEIFIEDIIEKELSDDSSVKQATLQRKKTSKKVSKKAAGASTKKRAVAAKKSTVKKTVTKKSPTPAKATKKTSRKK